MLQFVGMNHIIISEVVMLAAPLASATVTLLAKVLPAMIYYLPHVAELPLPFASVAVS
jgi:hypothetical protein